MVTPEFLDYIRQQLASGVAKDTVRGQALESGWNEHDILEAFTIIEGAKAPVPPVPPPPVLTPQPPGVPPLVPPQPTAIPPIVVPQHRSHTRALLFSVAALVLIGGGITYAYVQQWGPFSHIPYSEDNLLSGLLAASARIDTSSYKFTGSVTVVPRDKDAQPFTLALSNQEELRAQYQNDYQRARDVSTILSLLQLAQRATPTPHYPATLSSLSTFSTYYRNVKTVDPKTNTQYQYRVTDNGSNFELTVTFETADAVQKIRSESAQAYKYELKGNTSQKGSTESAKKEAVKVTGRTITFSKDSGWYFNVLSEPPKPAIESMGEMMRYLPAQFAVSFSAAATTDWTKENADWKFNADASGDIGDMTYKLNGDAVKKDGIYYLRLNNIPGLFGSSLTSYKGIWIAVDPSKKKDSTDYSSMGYLTSELPKAESSYKENRAEMTDFLKQLVTIADEEHVLTFTHAPVAEKVGDRTLYRYDVAFNKAAILPFYKRVQEIAATNKAVKDKSVFNDTGMVEYLQSDEFNQVFDYINANTFTTIYVDQKGYPALVTYTIREVPPDTATALKNKQVNVVLSLEFTDINKSVNIEKPDGAKSLEEISDELAANDSLGLGTARMKSRDAKRIADIRTIQVALERYKNDTQRYPTTLNGLVPKYVPTLPKDPTTNNAYIYAATGSSCSGFHLGAVLEDSSNYSLSQDEDAAVSARCAGSNPDFNGRSKACTATAGYDSCYDLTDSVE